MPFKPQSVKQFIITEVTGQKNNLFLWTPVFMGSGIVIYFQTGIMVPWAILIFLIFLLAIGGAFTVHAYSKTGQMRFLVALLTILALILPLTGYGIAKYRSESVTTVLLEKDLSARELEGVIAKISPLEGGKAKRVILENVIIGDETLRVRLKSYHFRGDNWRIGDRILVKAALMAPSGPVMPGGFDFSQKAYFEGISAVGYTLGQAKLLEAGSGNEDVIEHFRMTIADSLYDTMAPRHAGVAHALLTGERAGIKSEDSEAFRRSGLAHLLAISGLHIGMVAGCVFFFVRLTLALIPQCALRYPIKKWAAICAIMVAFCYMLLAGATVPTVRAFIMTSLVLLAVIMDRSALNMRLVALAALFVMITTPEAVIGPSFVMSFAAVAALIVFYRDIGRKWLVNANAYRPALRPLYYLFGIIVTSIVATLATAPFSILYFNRFAMYSVLSNILAMPVMAFIVMPFGLLGTLMTKLESASHFWVIMEWGIAHILTIAEAISAYDYASVPFASFDTLETILICSGFICLLLWNGYWRVLGLVLVFIAFVLSVTDNPKMVMIADDMQAVLYVDNSGDKLYLFGKMNNYIRLNWLGYHGYDADVDIIKFNYGDNMKISEKQCDDNRCRFDMYGTIMSVIHNPLFVAHACVDSDIVIIDIPLEKERCEAELVIGRFDVWRHGAMTIAFDKRGFVLETVK